jgi:uncharacterized protein
MHIDLPLAVAGLSVGLIVGLTGMGGGALLTPLLVLFFRVAPLAAISSDLLTSLVMKPLGAMVHVRQRTVHWRLAVWLIAGSVPSAFAGAMVIGAIGHASGVQGNLKLIIGGTLCASVAMMVLRQALELRQRRRDALMGRPGDLEPPFEVRPLHTVAIGIIGGFAVGMTSVGAGSLIIALLLIVYPGLRPAALVGTDIVQAIPLVAAATLGHLLFGDVQLALTTSLLLGALPGVYLGARLSAQGPAALIRPVLTGVLLASALALLGASTLLIATAATVSVIAVAALGTWRHVISSTIPAVPEIGTVG